MARRKRRGGRRGFRFGKYVNLAFKGLALAVAVSPPLPSILNDVKTGRIGEIGPDTLYAYTGIGKDGAVNWNQTAAGAGAVVGAVVIAKIGGWLAKRM